MTIHILTTGGTIDKAYFDQLSAWQFTQTVVPRLLEIARVTCPVLVETLFQKDSLDIDAGDRSAILRAVTASPHDRIIVTHGTDTMTDTAAALRDVADKVVVLVGALSPARLAESDAAFNLGMAMATAQVARPGIYITMNGTVFDALAVRKDRERGAFVADD